MRDYSVTKTGLKLSVTDTSSHFHAVQRRLYLCKNIMYIHEHINLKNNNKYAFIYCI